MSINRTSPNSWKDLQTQAALILSECGLTTEVEKTIPTVRGKVEVDVFAIDSSQTPPHKILCECKHWATAVSKGAVHGFRTVVADFGANTGYLISSAGFQSGALEAGDHSNVNLQTWDEFEATWLERWKKTYLRPRLYAASDTVFSYTEPLLGGSIVERLESLPEEKQQQFIALRQNKEVVLVAALAMHLGAPWHAAMGGVKLDLPYKPVISSDADDLPPKLTSTESFREFGDIICDRIAEIKNHFDNVFR